MAFLAPMAAIAADLAIWRGDLADPAHEELTSCDWIGRKVVAEIGFALIALASLVIAVVEIPLAILALLVSPIIRCLPINHKAQDKLIFFPLKAVGVNLEIVFESIGNMYKNIFHLSCSQYYHKGFN